MSHLDNFGFDIAKHETAKQIYIRKTSMAMIDVLTQYTLLVGGTRLGQIKAIWSSIDTRRSFGVFARNLKKTVL